MANKKFTIKQFLEAIPGSGGIISTICDRVGCSWMAARKFIDNNPQLLEVYTSECEKILDMAESKVIKMINEEDPQMIRYYLSTKGKRRGYTERTEQVVQNEDIVVKKLSGVSYDDI